MAELDPYKRGKDFELRLSRVARRKKIVAKRDKRSGAGDTYKSDIALPGLAWHVEAKSQSAIRLWDWWQQTQGSAGLGKTPLLCIDDGYEGLAVLRWTDFLDLIKTIQDDTETITELRTKPLEKGFYDE